MAILGIGDVTTARLAFGFAVFVFAIVRVLLWGLEALALGFVVRRTGFLTDFFAFTTRRREVAFLAVAFALARFLLAAFAFTGRAFRCLGLDRLFFPDFLAMLPPVRLELTLAAKCRIIRCLSQSLRSTPTARRS